MTIHPNFEADHIEISRGAHGPLRLSAREARQGVTLGRMRFVLTFGLALAMVAFAIIYLIYT
jgi:hypothetical protein